MKAKPAEESTQHIHPRVQALTLFNVTHPGLASVKADMFWQPTSHLNIREAEAVREGGCLKYRIKMHSVMQICTFCI